MIKYDIGVIGSGSAGSTVAYGMQAAGKTVAVFEDYLWGGTCANYGCDPKKILVNGVDVVRQAQLFASTLHGVINVDWPALMAKKQAYVDQNPAKTTAGFKAADIAMYHQRPKFINADTIMLANGEKIQAQTWVVATGKRPRKPTFIGAELVQDSEAFLNWEQLPTDVTLIGGGYIALELASIAQLAGAHVRVLQHNAQILKTFEPWLAETLSTRLQNQGVELQFNTEVTQVTKIGTEFEVTTTTGLKFITGAVVAAIGRKPAVTGLELNVAGVDVDAKGIIVNDYLQTANPQIYAVGDVAASGSPNLTPVAGYEAQYLVRQLTGTTTAPITYPEISTTVFTHPRIAQVGMKTQEAKAIGAEIKQFDLKPWFNYLRVNDVADAQIILRANKIVGASLIAENADEIINMFVHAINQQWTLADIKQQIMTYPTFESDLPYFYG